MPDGTTETVKDGIKTLGQAAVDKAIASLPEQFQDLGRDYAPVLVNMGVDEFIAWCGRLFRSETSEAALVEFYQRLTIEEQKRDLLASNENMRRLIIEGNAREKFGQELLRAAFQKVLLPLLTALLVGL